MGRLHVTGAVCLLLFTLLVAQLVVAAADGTVLVTTTPVLPEIPSDQEMTEFHVLLTVKATDVGTTRRVPIDLIVVHRISNDARLTVVQKAMEFISRRLQLATDKDRLVLVGSASVEHLTAPSEAKKKIEEHFKAARSAGRSTPLAELLRTANTNTQTSERAGAIIVLTDTDDVSSPGSLSGVITQKNYPVHTFGLGMQHNLKALRELASALPGGTYSFVHEDQITPALAVCVGGLMKIVVPGTSTLKLQAERGVSITYAKYRAPFGSDQPSSTQTIEIGTLQTGETKKILVSLHVSAATTQHGMTGSSGRCADKMTTLLTATFSRGPSDQSPITQVVCVERPNGRVPAIQAPPSRLVVEQIVRIKLIEVIREVSVSGPNQLWSKWDNFVRQYQYWSGIDVVLGDLHAEIDAMYKYTVASPSFWTHYIHSWISSHETQRPTAMGSSSNVVSVFITEQVSIMVHVALFVTDNEIVYQGDCKAVDCVDATKLKDFISQALESSTKEGKVCMGAEVSSPPPSGTGYALF